MLPPWAEAAIVVAGVVALGYGMWSLLWALHEYARMEDDLR